MPDDFSPGRSAGLSCDEGAQFSGAQMSRERLDLRGLAGSLAALKGDETPASRISFDSCFGHHQSFSAPARNIPITSSLAPSIARRIVDPVPTGSAANTGASTAILAPRHTLTTPIR